MWQAASQEIPTGLRDWDNVISMGKKIEGEVSKCTNLYHIKHLLITGIAIQFMIK